MRTESAASVEAQIAAINQKHAAAAKGFQPQLAAAFEEYKAAVDVLNAAHQRVRDAAADRVVFQRSLNAQVEQDPWHVSFFKLTGLLAVAGAEAMIAFPAMRFALGHLDNLPSNNPFKDPTALTASVGLAIASMEAAVAAARQISRAERGVIQEPTVADISDSAALPIGVTDPHGGALRLPNPVEEIAAESQASDELPAPEMAWAEDALDQANDDRAKQRYGRLFRDGRTKMMRRLLAGGLVVCGLSLWAGNGVMRSEYLQGMASRPVAPSGSSILGAVANPGKTAADDTLLETAIIVGSVLLFAIVVLVIACSASAVTLRAKDLRRAEQQRIKERKKLLKSATKTIKRYEKLRSDLALVKARAKHETDTSRAAA